MVSPLRTASDYHFLNENTKNLQVRRLKLLKFIRTASKFHIKDTSKNIPNHDSAVADFTVMSRTAEEAVVEGKS
jgi:hypothetical protein